MPAGLAQSGMKTFLALTFVALTGFLGATARAEAPSKEQTPTAETADAEAKEKPTFDAGFGVCMGLATRCGLLPKGICFMQSGCMNPLYGDRCGGSAKQCTGFSTKNLCMMQRGCTWVKQKPKATAKTAQDPESSPEN